MTTTIILISIGALLLFLVLMFIVIPSLVLRYVAKKLEKRVGAKFSEHNLLVKDLRALSFGQRKSSTPLRGNGALLLTRTNLIFLQLVPDIEINIPLESITRVDTVRSHLGKAINRDLLFVAWTDLDQTENAIAWYTPQLEEFRLALSAQPSA